MFREQRNGNKVKTLLVVAEIAAICIIALGLFNYVWENTEIRSLDRSLQIAVFGFFALLIILTANYVLNRRW